jgi:hypothetical protein
MTHRRNRRFLFVLRPFLDGNSLAASAMVGVQFRRLERLRTRSASQIARTISGIVFPRLPVTMDLVAAQCQRSG